MTKLHGEIARFVVVGCSAVVTDALVYFALIHSGAPHAPAKTISFITGSIVAYCANKFWTFARHEKSYAEFVRFVILYTATLGANVAVNAFTLKITTYTILAFLLATGTSTILNFIGQKWWVFVGTHKD